MNLKRTFIVCLLSVASAASLASCTKDSSPPQDTTPPPKASGAPADFQVPETFDDVNLADWTDASGKLVTPFDKYLPTVDKNKARDKQLALITPLVEKCMVDAGFPAYKLPPPPAAAAAPTDSYGITEGILKPVTTSTPLWLDPPPGDPEALYKALTGESADKPGCLAKQQDPSATLIIAPSLDKLLSVSGSLPPATDQQIVKDTIPAWQSCMKDKGFETPELKSPSVLVNAKVDEAAKANNGIKPSDTELINSLLDYERKLYAADMSCRDSSGLTKALNTVNVFQQLHMLDANRDLWQQAFDEVSTFNAS